MNYAQKYEELKVNFKLIAILTSLNKTKFFLRCVFYEADRINILSGLCFISDLMSNVE